MMHTMQEAEQTLAKTLFHHRSVIKPNTDSKARDTMLFERARGMVHGLPLTANFHDVVLLMLHCPCSPLQ